MNRLRWRCRRGMKELDVLLERFAARDIEQLPAQDLDALEQLLELPDDLLLACLTGDADPGRPGLRRIARAIRAASARSA